MLNNNLYPQHYDKSEDLRHRIECIMNRPMFILMYVISPYQLARILAEKMTEIDKDIEKEYGDNYLDAVLAEVETIIQTTFLTPKEIDNLLKFIKTLCLQTVSQGNEALKTKWHKKR